jgi:hypothetical protein
MGYIGQAPTKVPLTSADITDGTIALADMAANSVDSDSYVDGSIDTIHIGDDQVTGAKLNPAFVAGDIIYADGTDTINRLVKGTDTHVLTLASGLPSWAAPAAGGENNHTSFARGFSGSGQNTAITTNSMTVLEFSAETFDSDGDFNTTTDRYIVPANGYYLITGAAIYSSLADGVLNALQIAINGGIKSSAVNSMSISSFNSTSITDIYYCTAAQYIQLLTWHEKGSDAAIDADGWGGSGPYGSGTYLSVARIG